MSALLGLENSRLPSRTVTIPRAHEYYYKYYLEPKMRPTCYPEQRPAAKRVSFTTRAYGRAHVGLETTLAHLATLPPLCAPRRRAHAIRVPPVVVSL